MSMTALELYHREEESSKGAICKFSEEFDRLLGGSGLPLGSITELVGQAGIGKTQMCMQMCASVQLPVGWGGSDGHSVYIDTEGSFSTTRFSQILHGTISKFTECCHNKVSHHSIPEMLTSTYVVRCRDHIELSGAVFKLMNFVKSHPKIKLIVVDSLAFHLRHLLESGQDRNMLLANIAAELIKVAHAFNISVVVTNQMTTRFDGDVGTVAAALGHSWSHIPSTRLLLHKSPSNNKSNISLIKSPYLPNGVARFRITGEGIRDEMCDSPTQ